MKNNNRVYVLRDESPSAVGLISAASLDAVGLRLDSCVILCRKYLLATRLCKSCIQNSRPLVHSREGTLSNET